MRKREHRYKRRIKSIILVICEGQTERAYVEFLTRIYRLPIEVKTRVSGNNINARLIQNYINGLNLGRDDNYTVVLMYDADISSVVSKLKSLNEILILTNPCIELWFLLHIRDHTKETSSAAIVEALKESHPAWHSYDKGSLSQKQMSLLKERLDVAVARATRLTIGINPYTTMPEFIAILEKEKNS